MNFILTLACPDKPGIVHAVTGILVQHHGNIVEAAQYNDDSTKLFFMRVSFDVPETTERATIEGSLRDLADQFKMQWLLADGKRRPKALIMVSKLGHCLNDLLFRSKSGALPIEIAAVVSNHRDFYQMTASYGIPFHHVPVTEASKTAAEAKLLDIFSQENAEFVILARYMQILSNNLCQTLSGKVINIHHSFLPSFKGARPYYQAYDRGVKIIGATAHYVTADLDEGPIIEQDIARVDHSNNPEELTALGRDVECSVLARAVTWHAQNRVLVNGNKTVVFK
jgi:formyltetrahydrofolate deformylase